MRHSSAVSSTINHGSTARRKAAFTLVELLLVLVILTTLLGMAIPMFMAMGREQSGREIMHGVRDSLYVARQTAIDSGVAVQWKNSQVQLESDGPLLFYPNGTATDARIHVLTKDISVGSVYVIGSTGAIVPRDAK